MTSIHLEGPGQFLLVLGGLEVVGDGFHSQLAGHLARCVAPHAVGHDRQAIVAGEIEGILVVVPRDPHVGFARETNAHAVERKGGTHEKVNGIAGAGRISTASRPDERKSGSQLHRQVAARSVEIAVHGV